MAFGLGVHFAVMAAAFAFFECVNHQVIPIAMALLSYAKDSAQTIFGSAFAPFGLAGFAALGAAFGELI